MKKAFFFQNTFIYADEVVLSELGVYSGRVINGHYRFTYDTNTCTFNAGGWRHQTELTWACTIHFYTDDYNSVHSIALARREAGEPSDLYAPSGE